MSAVENHPKARNIRKKIIILIQTADLSKHTSASWSSSGLVWYTVHRHGLSVTREFQCELFLPHILNDTVAHCADLTLGQASLVCVVKVEFLNQDRQSSFCGFTNFLISVFSLKKKVKKNLTFSFNVKVQQYSSPS